MEGGEQEVRTNGMMPMERAGTDYGRIPRYKPNCQLSEESKGTLSVRDKYIWDAGGTAGAFEITLLMQERTLESGVGGGKRVGQKGPTKASYEKRPRKVKDRAIN